MSLKSFTGFRGVAALAELDGLQFVIIAHNAAELEAIYTALLPDAPAFNAAMCQKSVMIQAGLLPDPKLAAPRPALCQWKGCGKLATQVDKFGMVFCDGCVAEAAAYTCNLKPI